MSRRNAYGVYLTIETAASIGLALYSTISTVYRVEAAGLNPLQLMLIGTVLEGTYFIANVPTGAVADVYSRRLSIVIGLLLTGTGFILEGAIPRFGTILLAQVIWGTGASFRDGAQEAWIAGEIGDARVGQAFLRAAQVGAAGGIVGALVSVFVAGAWLGLPMIVAGMVYIALALFAAVAMPEAGFRRVPREERTNAWTEMVGTLRRGGGAVRRSPLLITILSIAVFAGMASEGFDRLWGAHLLVDIHLPALGHFSSVVWFGIIAVGAELLGILTTEFVRRAVATDSHAAGARVLFGINAALVLGVVVFGLAANFPLALAVYWGVFVLRSLRSPIYTAWLSQRIEPAVRATVLSMSSQLDALGQVAGGPVIGLIGTLWGLPVALVTTGVVLAPALPLVALARRQGHDLERPLASLEEAAVPEPSGP